MFKVWYDGCIRVFDGDVDNMVAQVAATLGLSPRARIGLFDIDQTLSDRPDGYQALVRRYAKDPEVWLTADREYNATNGRAMSTRALFQLALDQIEDPENFSVVEFVQFVSQIHELVPGVGDLVNLLSNKGVTMILVTNGLLDVLGPLLDTHGFKKVLMIGNWIEDERINSRRKLTFASPFGEAGMNKEAVATAFTRAGFTPCIGAGDSGSDMGLLLAAVMSGGGALVRAGLSLAKMCAKVLPKGSWLEYDTFDPATLDWVADRIPSDTPRVRGHAEDSAA